MANGDVLALSSVIMCSRRASSTLLVVLILLAAAVPAFASPIGFVVSVLATNSTDSNLVNPWGMASSATSPIWIADNGTGTSVLYNGAGVKQGLTVSILGDGSVTGIAFANVAGAFNGDAFLFVSEDGTISGWRGALGTTAEVLQTGLPTNVYKGMTVADVSGHEYMYAANFHTGNIDVLKGDALAPSLSGNFTDPNLPAGYAPFDIQNLNGKLYVTYAIQNGNDDLAGPGNGIVDVFNLDGTLDRRLVTGGLLNSPWGLALAPAGFGDVGGNLLVGNFGDGRINAYDPLTGAFVETLVDMSNQPITLDGLWGLRFGNGGNGGAPLNLFFTAGPNGETGGMFGVIGATAITPPSTVPEPGTMLLVSGGLAALLRRRRR